MSISQAHQDRLVAQGRDEMMTAFCVVARPNEAQQRDASERFTAFMQDLIPQIVGVVAVGDYPAFAVKLDNIDGKGKIALKAMDVDTAGPALITHMGASLTLVLTDAGQFDRMRPGAMIQPDQRPLPLEVAADEAFVEEMGEIAEEVSDQTTGPLFTVVEAKPLKLDTGEVVRAWTIVHGDAEIFAPNGAENIVLGIAERLNELAGLIERDPAPMEVHNSVMAVLDGLAASGNHFGIAFNPPYTLDAIQDNAAPANDEPAAKRGPKTRAEKVEAYFAGYDGAANDLMTEDCPHERGVLREGWLGGLQDAKAGKPARWTRPGQAAANDDGEEPRESSGNVAA